MKMITFQEIFMAAPKFTISPFGLSYVKLYLTVICKSVFFFLLADTSKYIGK